MIRGRFQSTGAAFNALTEQLARGKAPREANPTRLPLMTIAVWPEVFQLRRPAKHVSDSHVRSLADTAKHRELDPLTIWWDGKRWALIDGHHRFAAYREVGKSNAEVPVVVFAGSLAEAMRKAAQDNSKDKLPMSRSEKTNAAWRLVTTTELSRKETAEAAGISEASVAEMRRVRALLQALMEQDGSAWNKAHPNKELADVSWMEARRIAKGQDAADIDWDDFNEKKAQEWATAFHKVFGKDASNRPEALARALELYNPRLPAILAELWSKDEEDEGAELEDEAHRHTSSGEVNEDEPSDF